ncbi:MAG: hypothetical protein VX416_10675, partial [Pseudomonadota bacterium]|nr:hypothetical protein [Pseudomonadota bacterium]
MNEINIAENTENSGSNASVFVPSLQLTKGQPEPIAANGGLSYYSFDDAGDAGTGVALQAAFDELSKPERAEVIELIENGPTGPIETKWGVGFRSYDECVAYIKEQGINAPEGGLALPLPYTIYERPTYSVVPSNAIWHDPARSDDANRLREAEEQNRHLNLYFPQIMRDARR